MVRRRWHTLSKYCTVVYRLVDGLSRLTLPVVGDSRALADVGALAPEADGSTRLCESCLRVRSLTEFRRRKRGLEHRMRQCRRCHNELERYRRAAIRARLGRRRIARDLAKVRNASSASRVKAICGAVVRGYGGTEGFLGAWLACLKSDLPRGGFVAMRHLEATIRLILHCERDRPDYSQMTDEDLLDRHQELQRTR